MEKELDKDLVVQTEEDATVSEPVEEVQSMKDYEDQINKSFIMLNKNQCWLIQLQCLF